MAKEMPEVPWANGPNEPERAPCPGCDGEGTDWCETCLSERKNSDETVEHLIEDLTEAIKDVHVARWSPDLDLRRVKAEVARLRDLLRRTATEFGVTL